MSISDFDISNMDNIMSDYRSSEYSWFTAKLLRLMADSDLDNLTKLATVYPKEFVEFAMWKWQGIPYLFITVDSVKVLMTKDALFEHKYRWINPETGAEVKSVEMTHGRDF